MWPTIIENISIFQILFAYIVWHRTAQTTTYRYCLLPFTGKLWQDEEKKWKIIEQMPRATCMNTNTSMFNDCDFQDKNRFLNNFVVVVVICWFLFQFQLLLFVWLYCSQAKDQFGHCLWHRDKVLLIFCRQLLVHTSGTNTYESKKWKKKKFKIKILKIFSSQPYIHPSIQSAV